MQGRLICKKKKKNANFTWSFSGKQEDQLAILVCAGNSTQMPVSDLIALLISFSFTDQKAMALDTEGKSNSTL